MAILGIDYGAKKIGLAKSDDSERLALPLEILPNIGHESVLKRLEQIFLEHNITKIVVGVPLSLSSEKSQTFLRQADLQNKQMQEVLVFVDWLRKTVAIPVDVEDERLSTKMANKLQRGMIGKGNDDHVAAMLILQTYLDRNRKQ